MATDGLSEYDISLLILKQARDLFESWRDDQGHEEMGEFSDRITIYLQSLEIASLKGE